VIPYEYSSASSPLQVVPEAVCSLWIGSLMMSDRRCACGAPSAVAAEITSAAAAANRIADWYGDSRAPV
jgi:hypothetical protein